MSIEHDNNRLPGLNIDLEDALESPSDLDRAQVVEGMLDHLDVLQGQLDQVSTRLSELQLQNDHLHARVHHFNEQMSAAGRLQLDFLPKSLPQCDGLRISSLYLPADALSGDMYDVVRLNDTQLELSISDATGHGPAGALLGMLAKQCLRNRPHPPGEQRFCYPHEILHELDEQLLRYDLPDCHFIASIHALYDEIDGSLLWARGGLPYPVLVRQGRQPKQLTSEGGLIGVLPDQEYDLVSTKLARGDLLLFHTDGLDALLLNTDHHADATTVLETKWCRTLTSDTLQSHLERIEELVKTTPKTDWPIDDITLLVLEGV